MASPHTMPPYVALRARLRALVATPTDALLTASVACLALGMLAIGSLLPQAACVLGLGPAAVLAYALKHNEASPGARVPAIVWPFIFFSAYTSAQVVPLPAGLLRVLSPAAADTWARALAVSGAPFGFAPLSLAPELTRLEVVK